MATLICQTEAAERGIAPPIRSAELGKATVLVGSRCQRI